MLKYDNDKFIVRPEIDINDMASVVRGICEADLCLGVMAKKSLNSKKSFLLTVPMSLDIEEFCGPRKKREGRPPKKVRSGSMSTIASGKTSSMRSENSFINSIQAKAGALGGKCSKADAKIFLKKLTKKDRSNFDIIKSACEDSFCEFTSHVLAQELKGVLPKGRDYVTSMAEIESMIENFTNNVLTKYDFVKPEATTECTEQSLECEAQKNDDSLGLAQQGRPMAHVGDQSMELEDLG
jgi:hypothetical protein